jgi:hypothetical protein
MTTVPLLTRVPPAEKEFDVESATSALAAFGLFDGDISARSEMAIRDSDVVIRRRAIANPS